MPATVTTKEQFKKTDYQKSDVEEEAKLRLLAGAITSKVEDGGDDWILVTEWNVFGQQ